MAGAGLGGGMPLLLVAAVALALVALVDTLWARARSDRVRPPSFPLVG